MIVLLFFGHELLIGCLLINSAVLIFMSLFKKCWTGLSG